MDTGLQNMPLLMQVDCFNQDAATEHEVLRVRSFSGFELAIHYVWRLAYSDCNISAKGGAVK